jgi:hypothetical protein
MDAAHVTAFLNMQRNRALVQPDSLDKAPSSTVTSAYYTALDGATVDGDTAAEGIEMRDMTGLESVWSLMGLHKAVWTRNAGSKLSSVSVAGSV